MSHIYLTIHQSNRTQKRSPPPRGKLSCFLTRSIKTSSPPANFGLSIQSRAAGCIDKADRSAAGRDQPWKCLHPPPCKEYSKDLFQVINLEAQKKKRKAQTPFFHSLLPSLILKAYLMGIWWNRLLKCTPQENYGDVTNTTGLTL